LKKTALNAIHRELGGQMVEFAGYELPVKYTSINEEHRIVREKVGLFDLTHMGEFWVEGAGALEFVHSLTTNNIAALEDGQVIYTPMCYEDGGIVDDLLVYRFSAERVLMVVNGACLEKDWDWVKSHLPDGLTLTNRSNETTLIAIQGPRAEEVVASVTDLPLSPIEFYHFVLGKVAGFDDVIVSRTGYTGEDGFELYLPNEQAAAVWNALMPKVRELGGAAIGLGARDTLRLEMKYCLYGNDIDQTTNPLEAGLSWTVKLKQGDFIGRAAIAKVKEEKPKRSLICFEMVDKGIARHDAACYLGEEKLGHVTSGTMSPSLGKAIGLAYLNRPNHKSGTEFEIEIRGKRKKAVVVKPPFYKGGSRK